MVHNQVSVHCEAASSDSSIVDQYIDLAAPSARTLHYLRKRRVVCAFKGQDERPVGRASRDLCQGLGPSTGKNDLRPSAEAVLAHAPNHATRCANLQMRRAFLDIDCRSHTKDTLASIYLLPFDTPAALSSELPKH